MLAFRKNRILFWTAWLLLAVMAVLFLHHHEESEEAFDCQVCHFASSLLCFFCILLLLFAAGLSSRAFRPAEDKPLPLRGYALFRNRAPPCFLHS